jgi:hypothetical protein
LLLFFLFILSDGCYELRSVNGCDKNAKRLDHLLLRCSLFCIFALFCLPSMAQRKSDAEKQGIEALSSHLPDVAALRFQNALEQ